MASQRPDKRKKEAGVDLRRLRPLLETVYIYREKGALKQEGRKMTQAQRERSCAQLVQGEFEDRLKELHTVEGLCFDYVNQRHSPTSWRDIGVGSPVGEDRGTSSGST